LKEKNRFVYRFFWFGIFMNEFQMEEIRFGCGQLQSAELFNQLASNGGWKTKYETPNLIKLFHHRVFKKELPACSATLTKLI
jgi:hypothetical protein